ncbi:MAG: tetratricopeptide repeat protein, partial [Phycisphaerae bacterium]
VRLTKALRRDPTDGLSWYFQGVCHLKLGSVRDALRCAQRAARCREPAPLGHDLAGRAYMRLNQYSRAVDAFAEAVRRNPADTKAQDHLLLALYASGSAATARERARAYIAKRPTDLVPRAILALQNTSAMDRFVDDVRGFVGAMDFQMIETSLVFAEVRLISEAAHLLSAVCVEAQPSAERSPLPIYYLAWFAALRGDEDGARANLTQAGALYKDFVFASRPDAIDVLKYAARIQPDDAYAHFHLGNVYGGLGRLDEAVAQWEKAAELDPSLSIAFRNLGLYSQVIERDRAKAAQLYRKAIVARPEDQTLYRDLANILAAEGRHDAAIELLQSIPSALRRRADVVLTLAQLYVDTERFTAAIELLQATPYFVNWEGDSLPWVLFNRAHVGRGGQRLRSNKFEAALRDFEAALTYPENLGVGRSNEHEHAAAHYWRGKTLAALGRPEDARSAWRTGAAEPEGSEQQNRYREMCRAALSGKP